MPFVIETGAKMPQRSLESETMLADIKILMTHMMNCPTCSSAFALAELQARRHISLEAQQKQQQGGGSP